MATELPYGTTNDKKVERVNGDEFVYKFVEHDGDSWRGIIDVCALLDGVESGEVVDSDDDVNLDMLSDSEHDDTLTAYVHRDELVEWVEDEFSDIVDERPRIGDVYEHRGGDVAYLGEYGGSKFWLDLDGKQSGHKLGGSPDSYDKLPDFEHEDVFVFPQSGGIHDSGDPVRHIPLDIGE